MAKLPRKVDPKAEPTTTAPTPVPPSASQVFLNTFNVLSTPMFPAAQMLTPVIGSVTFQLAGFGSQMPRIIDTGYIAKATEEATNEGEGFFSTYLIGNSGIDPAGTYYAVTFADENGDILQTVAYIIPAGSQVNLGELQPYDPNQPPPPLPPLVTDQLLVLPWSQTMEFPGDVYTAFRVTLTGDVTSSTAPDTVPGNLYTFIIQQDAAGGHLFSWPTNLVNATPINPNPNSRTVQTFVMATSNLYPISAGTWYL